MSVPEPAQEQAAAPAVAQTASNDCSAALILPGRSGWDPQTATDLERFAPDVLRAFNSLTGLDAVEICRRGTKDLNPLSVAEPVSFVLNFSYARELIRRGVRVAAYAGYSLGEYAALVLAGSIEFETALRLVRARADAIATVIRKHPLRMVRVEGAQSGAIVEICEEQGDVWAATFDSPRQMMVGGEPRALDRAAPKFKELGADRIVLVLNNGGLHTPSMAPARETIAMQLADVKINAPHTPVVSSVSAQVEQDPERWRQLLADQVQMPVRWNDALQALPVGPPLIECAGDRLVKLAADSQPGRTAFAVDSMSAVETVAQQLGAIAA